jgi:hypothetical protein
MMDIVRKSMQAGEQEAWERLAALDPREVCRRTAAVFDRSKGVYRLQVFSRTMLIAPANKDVRGETHADTLLLDRLQDYAPLSILGYLLHAQPVPPSGRIIKPAEMTGGQIYVTGSHVLPLRSIADRYGANNVGFLDRGRELGGGDLPHADVAVRVAAFPLIDLFFLLWLQDEEFAARCELLVDASCEFQLPPDVLWLTTMMGIAAML